MIKLFGTKLKCVKRLGLRLVHLVVLMSWYSKVIGCRNRRNGICGSRRRSSFPYGRFLIGNCNPCGSSLVEFMNFDWVIVFCFDVTILMYSDVVL